MKRFGLSPELYPYGDSINIGPNLSTPDEWLLFGRLSEYGERYKVKLDVTKEKVISIFGKRGQGKSFTLGTLLEGMCTVNKDTSILG